MVFLKSFFLLFFKVKKLKSRMCRQRFAVLNPQRRIFFFLWSFTVRLSPFHTTCFPSGDS